jgi:F-type H+-transporting ATPase subunit a
LLPITAPFVFLVWFATGKPDSGKKSGYISGIITLLTAWSVVSLLLVEPGVPEFEEISTFSFSLFGYAFVGNKATLFWTWVIGLILVVLSWAATRRLGKVPGRYQGFWELAVSALASLCEDTLGQRLGRKYLAFVGSIFLFVLAANWIGIIPTFWRLIEIDGHTIGPHWLQIEEPTRDLNTTLGLGILVFFVVHISAIIIRGPKAYIWEYFEPSFVIGRVKIPNLFMFALNVVGEFGKVISHSFRLFGNIMGGAVIIIVVSALVRQWVLPVGLSAFFGLFVGTIQAFVFAMLALTYLAVAISSEET